MTSPVGGEVAGTSAGGAPAIDGAEDGTPAIEVRGLVKRYDGVDALSGVTIDVRRGSITGLLGANGAGKTTLLKSVLGLVIPTEGTVLLDGVNVFDRNAAVRGDLAAVFEGARNVYWRLTARENVALFARLHGASTTGRRVDRALETVGLSGRADVPAGELSRGMKQRCALACALVRDARILVLDEPTLGLDLGSRADLLDLLVELVREEGRTILVSSHDMGVVDRICDRAVVLERGRVVADAPVSALKEAFETRTCSVTLEREVDAAAVPSVTDAFETADWRIEHGRTRFEVVLPAPDDVYALVAGLRRAGLPLRSVSRVEPDLGSIFASITDDDPGGIE